MASVRLEGIWKRFGETTALHGIDLEINDREFMVLVGPSGCGKSTLLRIVAGLEIPSEGEVVIGDRPVTHLAPKQRDIAMVFQSYALYPHLTVYNNIAFGLRRQGDRPAIPFSSARRAHNRSIDGRVQEIARQLQIDQYLNRKPKELSGGQKQRVALGRAMARNPQVFLLDEPLSNLDAKLRGETRSQIVQLQRQLETTALYVTHDQTEAMTMGDRIAVLRHGHLQQVDSPLKLYRQPANQFVAQFIGSPSMNFLPARLGEGGLLQGEFLRQGLVVGDRLQNQLKQGLALTVGARPERVMPAPIEQAHLVGEVSLVEVLGAQTIVGTRLGDSLQLLSSVAPELGYRVGEQAGWRLDPEQIHLFDGETKMAIIHPRVTSIG